MFSGVSLKDVRGFSGEESDFAFKPLTIFCGTNSAGKSTLLKLLPLLKQSLSEQGQLRLNGELVDFGTFKNFVSFGELDREPKVSFSVVSEPSDSLTNLLISSCPARVATTIRKKLESKSPSLQSDIELVFRVSDSEDRAALTKPFLSRGGYCFTLCGVPVLKLSVRGDGSGDDSLCLLEMPRNVWSKFSERSTANPVSQDQYRVTVVSRLQGLFPDTVFMEDESGEYYEESDGQDQANLEVAAPQVIRQAVAEVRRQIRDVAYLGPFRSPAQRYYLPDSEHSGSRDPAGAFLPLVLRDHSDDLIEFLHPKTWSPDRLSLTDWLNTWLHYLKSGNSSSSSMPEIRTEFTKGVVGEVAVAGSEGGLYPLSDSGFGFSQVLPILTSGLLAKREHVLVVEQPELHLNPALQIRLSEFFVALVLLGVQVVIETHSEHIVNAVRATVAEDSSDRLTDHCRITFLTSGRAPIHLDLDEFGGVEKWPREFFGEALELAGRVLRAQHKSRKG